MELASLMQTSLPLPYKVFLCPKRQFAWLVTMACISFLLIWSLLPTNTPVDVARIRTRPSEYHYFINNCVGWSIRRLIRLVNLHVFDSVSLLQQVRLVGSARR